MRVFSDPERLRSLAGGLLALSDRGTGVPLRELVLVGLTAAIITYFATGPVRVMATRFGAVAYPRERDVHETPTPRMGGLAMYLGVIAAVFLASQLPALTRGFVYSSGMPAVLVAGGVIMGIGLIDDKWGLDALTKFAGQITAASVLVTMGVAWSVLYIPFGGVGTIVLDQVSSILLTLALTVSIVNAMNFVDGLDGLAAGLGLITALAICMFSVGLLRDHGGDVLFYPPAVISVVLAGACLGFLPHNFHRAKIFMGDSGSMLIGLMLAAASTTAAGPISQTPTALAMCLLCCPHSCWWSRSCSCPCSTCCWRSFAALAPECTSPLRTRCTCITACCRSVTRIAAWCSSSICGWASWHSARQARFSSIPARPEW